MVNRSALHANVIRRVCDFAFFFLCVKTMFVEITAKLLSNIVVMHGDSISTYRHRILLLQPTCTTGLEEIYCSFLINELVFVFSTLILWFLWLIPTAAQTAKRCETPSTTPSCWRCYSRGSASTARLWSGSGHTWPTASRPYFYMAAAQRRRRLTAAYLFVMCVCM